WKLTSMTAGTKRRFRSKPGVRCSTDKSRGPGSPINFLGLTKYHTQRIGNFTDRCARFDGADEWRHQVRSIAGGGGDRVERAAPVGRVAGLTYRLQTLLLVPFNLGIDSQHVNPCVVVDRVAIHAD